MNIKVAESKNFSSGQYVEHNQRFLGTTSYAMESFLWPYIISRNIKFDGKVKTAYPRILLSELSALGPHREYGFIRTRIERYRLQRKRHSAPCNTDGLLHLVVCSLIVNNADIQHRLVQKMQTFRLIQPKAANKLSNGWELALAYDLSQSFIPMKDKRSIESIIAKALKETLVILDEHSSSLWHTRSSHASIAWLETIVLPDDYPGIESLRKRAQRHFLGAIDALSFTGVWPEGYNYWIQNRAFLFALASSAYINGLENAEHSERIRALMRKVGYWHIYATRPDNVIEGYGDEGSRVDLKDETRRVIDLIAQLTQDPVLAGYSRYLEKLHGSAGYYRGYRWGFLLFNDPFIPAVGNGTLVTLGPYLDNSVLFGENTMNYAYLRSGWSPLDTFITFKAGHTFTHHGHYDAGHFTVFKGAPLAINSSTYGDYYSEHRLDYAIRTVAKNSLLVLKPEEVVKPNRFFKNNVSDGGQRITLPTGSAITSVGHWLSNFRKGMHLEGAELLKKKISQDRYHYFSVDLTPAYNNTEYDVNGDEGKVRKVTRDFLYLPNEDHVVIYDRVTSTDSSYKKKWLLHTVKRPELANEKMLIGNMANGISESTSSIAQIRNKNGFLKVTKILPKESVFRTVGGPDYQYYVETDGDDEVLNGKNYTQGSANKPWFDIGSWRLELQPTIPAMSDEFLVVLSPSLDKPKETNILPIAVKSNNAVGIVTDRTAVLIIKNNRAKEISFSLPNGKNKIIILGLDIVNTVGLYQKGRLVQDYSVDGSIVEIESTLLDKGTYIIKW